jgi:uncharacterized protein (DUF2235 family)
MSEAAFEEVKHRHIVLFSDGTGNSSASFFKTNVRRLFEALDVTDPAPPVHPRQFAFYDDGVGSSSFRPLALLGGAFGLGLTRNVCDLYAALCRTYRPGDKIYGFGFSRGAFTMRILVGLIMNQGIVRYDGNEAHLARRARDAYRAYRIDKYRRGAGMWLAQRLGLAQPSAGYDRTLNHGHPEAGPGKAAGVAFLGLWDTVDAYGLPVDELTYMVDRWIWPLTMSDAVLCERVDRACHALSLDDQRETFHPRLWTERAASESRGAEVREGAISQVWFAGMHADLGGGYPDDSLAHTSLLWMTGHAEARGLRFMESIRDQQRSLADENGFMHDSRRGLGGFYRYQPRDVWALGHQFKDGSWRPRVHIPKPKIHESALRRMSAGTGGYAPLSLPSKFDVVLVGQGGSKGGSADLDQVQDGRQYLGRSQAEEALYRADRRHVWTWVWWRSVAYFVTLGGSLSLLLMPLWKSKAACVSFGCALSPVILALDAVLPSGASTWLRVFAAHPQTTVMFLAIVAAGLWAGGRLQWRVSDRMRRVWYARTPRVRDALPRIASRIVPPQAPGIVNGAVEWLLSRKAYKRVARATRQQILPYPFVAVAGYLALALVNHVTLAASEAAGWTCEPEDKAPTITLGQNATGHFATRDSCKWMGVWLHKDVSYRIELLVPAASDRDGDWLDSRLPAGPNGIDPQAVPFYMNLAVPFRRHLTAPWYKLMVRIGERGSGVVTPEWRLVSNAAGVSTYAATVVADRTGPLFLYVNDAATALPGANMYWNNQGTADVRIVAVSGARP